MALLHFVIFTFNMHLYGFSSIANLDCRERDQLSQLSLRLSLWKIRGSCVSDLV